MITKLADSLADAFIAALRPKLRALVDAEIAHAKAQADKLTDDIVIKINKPITDFRSRFRI